MTTVLTPTLREEMELFQTMPLVKGGGHKGMNFSQFLSERKRARAHARTRKKAPARAVATKPLTERDKLYAYFKDLVANPKSNPLVLGNSMMFRNGDAMRWFTLRESDRNTLVKLAFTNLDG